MRKIVYSRDPKDGKWKGKVFDTDKSIFVCHTPQGDLYKKKFYNEFFTWKNGDEKPIVVSWADANELVRVHGTREQHLNMFTTYGASTSATKNTMQIELDEYHAIKAKRNASRLNLTVRKYVCRLIDKDDANNNYCK